MISTTKLVDDHSHDPKRVFLSDERNDNPLDCIVSKVKILQVDPKVSAVVYNCGCFIHVVASKLSQLLVPA
jgi:hypothetical protein